MKVITQDNLWFGGPPGFGNYRRNGRDMIPFEPLLGRTSSRDMEAKQQELQWLMRYTGRLGGGLVLAQEWTGPGRLIDRNLAPWIEMFERHGRRARWCIFYDSVLAVRSRLQVEPPLDFGSAEILDLWREDLDHLEPLFRGPKYWKRDGRPVLYVWALHSGVRNAGRAFAEADRRGLFVLGDVFGSSRQAPANMRGATGFTSVFPPLGQRDHDLVSILGDLEENYIRWGNRLDTIPAASLQYDDTEFQEAIAAGRAPARPGAAASTLETDNSRFAIDGPLRREDDPRFRPRRAGAGAAAQELRRPTRVLAHSRDDLRKLLRLMKRYADTGEVFLGTANNWAEGTTLLPTERLGPEFGTERIGNYHFAHLEVVREELFPGVREYSGPRLRAAGRLPNRERVDCLDTDVQARIIVRPRKALLEDKILRGFRRRLLVRPGARVRVVNVDGRKAELVV